MFCTLNFHEILAYSISSTLVLLPPPVVAIVVTGYRAIVPREDDSLRTSTEQQELYRANTAAGLGKPTEIVVKLRARDDNFIFMS